MGLVFLVVLGLAFAGVWLYLARRPHPEAKIGPDGTNVREPESFVVHHEGKGQSLDIANTALKERTEKLRRDLPGDAHKIKTPVPGREMVRLSEPPPDVSKYGDEKVAPGSVPGMPGAESKEKVLTEGPQGSRPETPEEPGSPYQKGRRVTDIHRDVELASELLPTVESEGRSRVDHDMAASPSTTGQEPGYGLGRTAPGETDGEGGHGDLNEGGAPRRGERRGPDALREQASGPNLGRRKVIPLFRWSGPGQVGRQPGSAEADAPDGPGLTEGPDAGLERFELGEEPFSAGPTLIGAGGHRLPGDLTWAHLDDEDPSLPATYGWDEVVAVVRNPRSLYVYWDVEAASARVREMLGEEEWRRTIPCLRVFDVTPGLAGAPVRTIDVGPFNDHWFINDGIEPGHRYVVSYERRTPDGRYYLLNRSDPVQLPYDSPAPPVARTELYRMYGGQPAGWTGSPWR